MRIRGNDISFLSEDKAFLKKFGFEKAAEMVMDYRAHNSLPFIYDVYQLAGFLGISLKELFSIAKDTEGRYYQKLVIAKKNGQGREIYAPSHLLKRCQSIILKKILSELPVSRYAMAYKKGVSVSQNAMYHVGKKYILKLDIIDFFKSIRYDQVYSSAFNTKYFPRQIGAMLTSICCLDDALVQGAPTSPALSNLVMKRFDDYIGRWCEKRGIAYTRYCDDMTFSSEKPLYHVYIRVRDMLSEMGFELNEQKTHFVNNSSRQSVTGLTVNERVSVSREYKRELRQEIYYILKFGIEDHLKNKGGENGDHCALRYLDVIQGKINYILSVEPENKQFREALEKVKKQRAILEKNDKYYPYYR